MKKLNLALLVLTVLGVLTMNVGRVQAAEDYSKNEIGIPTYLYYDMYDRQFDYRIQRNHLREQIDARREAYIQPNFRVYENYKKKRENLYNDDKEYADETDGTEVFGPPEPRQ